VNIVVGVSQNEKEKSNFANLETKAKILSSCILFAIS